MKNDIEFTRMSFAEVKAAVRRYAATTYVGGSNKATPDEFRKYIRAKASEKLERTATVCGWAATKNAKTADNKLFGACKEACPDNTQRRSNVKPAPGFVYLLR